MLSKSRIKFIRSLRLTKFRREEKLFIVEGDKMVKEALDTSSNHVFAVKAVYGTGEWLKKNITSEASQDIEIVQISNKELGQVSNLKTPNSVLALLEWKHQDIKTIKPENSPLLCLDEIQDPGNVGTIMRIADWFGLQNIILGESCADPFSPKVVQASMGSVFRVSVFETNLADYLTQLREPVTVYGAVMDGENIYREDLKKNSIIILGNESRGISPAVQKSVTRKITIPPSGKNGPGPESLNVSVACGIILSEFFR